MGLHAFVTEPGHCAVYRAIRGPALPRIIGYDECWNMPVARHTVALSGDVEFKGVDHFILTYHVSGDRVRRVDRPEFIAVADRGALSVQTPGSSGRFQSLTGRSTEYAHFYFRQSMLEEIADAYRLSSLGAGDFFGLRGVGCEADLRDYLRRAFAADDPATAIEMDSRAYLIALGLVRYWTQRPDFSEERAGALPAEKLSRVFAFVESRIADNVRLSDLATVASLSPFHFARSFKAATGETPASYVIRRRVERARELLVHTRLPIVEIAYRVGFSSQSHLTRRLKDLLGTTPGKLRNIRDDIG